MISGSLFTAHKAGNITAIIFWLKTSPKFSKGLGASGSGI